MHKSTKMAFAAWEIQKWEESPISTLIQQLLSPFHCSVGEGSRRTTQGDDSHPRKCLCEKTDVPHPHQHFSPTGMCCPLENWLLETSRPFYIFKDKHPDCWTAGRHGRQCSSRPATDWNCNNHNLEVASWDIQSLTGSIWKQTSCSRFGLWGRQGCSILLSQLWKKCHTDLLTHCRQLRAARFSNRKSFQTSGLEVVFTGYASSPFLRETPGLGISYLYFWCHHFPDHLSVNTKFHVLKVFVWTGEFNEPEPPSRITSTQNSYFTDSWTFNTKTYFKLFIIFHLSQTQKPRTFVLVAPWTKKNSHLTKARLSRRLQECQATQNQGITECLDWKGL